MAALEPILTMAELKAVARVHLPEAGADAINGVAMYAETSSSYVAGIEHVAKRAMYIAKKAGRNAVATADVVSAIKARSTLDLSSAAIKAQQTPRESSPARSTSFGRLSSPGRSVAVETDSLVLQPH
jgi:histone H3/H4